MISNGILRVGGILPNSLVNGEGIRMVIFMSGCDKDCKGCHNQELRDFNYGKDMSIADVINAVKESLPLIDGVTLSGGDPLCQYPQVLELCMELKKIGVNIWLYTGETIGQIVEKNKCDLFKYVDVIVDGPFIQSHHKDDLRYRGSTNQRIVYFKDGVVDECLTHRTQK